jgi:hypothetical protein
MSNHRNKQKVASKKKKLDKQKIEEGNQKKLDENAYLFYGDNDKFVDDFVDTPVGPFNPAKYYKIDSEDDFFNSLQPYVTYGGDNKRMGYFKDALDKTKYFFISQINSLKEQVKKLNETNLKIFLENQKLLEEIKSTQPSQVIEKVVEVDKPTIIEKIDEVPRKRKTTKMKEHIKIPYKVSSCSMKYFSFDVELYRTKDIVPSKTIPLTMDNINLISSQLIKGTGQKKKGVIISYLDKISHLDDLLNFKKIGIGKTTVNKLKQYFHIDDNVKLIPSVIDKLIVNNNLPLDDLSNDGGQYNLPFDNEPPNKHSIYQLVNSIKKYCI